MISPILISLPWPATALWQNRRVHWAAKGKATAVARKGACYAAMACNGFYALRNASRGTYRLSFNFYPPDRRKRDLQNMPATQKATIDGIADALGIDDNALQIEWPMEWGTVADDGGSVTVLIRPVAACMAAEREA
jgi:crossover junction endodeoxyribonuclease RusA